MSIVLVNMAMKFNLCVHVKHSVHVVGLKLGLGRVLNNSPEYQHVDNQLEFEKK